MAKEQDQAGVQAVSDGPEFRFIGHLLGALIASAGLLAGTMMRERSFDYWLEDIVPLALLAVTLRGVLLNAVELAKLTITHNENLEMLREAEARQQAYLSKAAQIETELAHMPAKKHGYSEEEVLEAVSKRLQEKKEEAMKHNKFAPQG